MNELKFIESILDYLNIEGKILFDVGAHFGSFSKPFAEKNWKIHAFEPDPDNRVKLETWAHEFPGLMINPNAVADKPAAGAKFFKSDESTGISSLSSFTDGHFEGPLVDIITLKEYCLGHLIEDIDLLKVDTEGHDLFVLKGFPWEKIKPKVVMTEFENKKTVPLGYRYEDLAQYLVAQGYSVFVSEWKPIVRYGIQHDWNRCFMYPGPLETEDAWGNFIALRNDFNRNVFWYGIADVLCVADQVSHRREQIIQARNEQFEKKDELNFNHKEMVLALNDKMAEVERILLNLEKNNEGKIGKTMNNCNHTKNSNNVNGLLAHFKEIYKLLPYEILSYFSAGLCLDVGAAAGFSTKRMLSANAECKVLAFEPFDGNLPHLKHALSDIEGWQLVSKAVSNFSGKGGFFVSSTVKGTEKNWQGLIGYSSIGHLIPFEKIGRYDSERTSTVDVCCIDEYVTEHVLFMKMDVQGAEFEVLQGAKQTIKNHGISVIYVEFSGDIRVLEIISDLGYLIFDTKYLLIPQVENVMPESLGMLENQPLHLSTGKTALEGFIPSRPQGFSELCDFMKKIHNEVGFFQTDLYCVHSSFLPSFLNALSAAYKDVECSQSSSLTSQVCKTSLF